LFILIPMLDNHILGWLSVGLAITFHGSFGVPIKKKAVLEANVHPIIYQLYKSFWCFVTSFIVLFWKDFVWTNWGIVNGAIWIPAGVLAIVGIRLIGLGIAQGIWSGLTIIVAFSWGMLFFHEHFGDLPKLFAGIALLLVGVLGLGFAPVVPPTPWASSSSGSSTISSSSYSSHDSVLNTTPAERSPLLNAAQTPDDVMFAQFSPKTRRAIGYIATIGVGVLAGCMKVPLQIVVKEGIDGIAFTVCFGIGTAIIQTFVFLVWIAYLALTRQPFPGFHFRVMMIPGFISGVLWSAGNLCGSYAVIYLGETIGWPASQAALVVSGIWGIILYRELRYLQIFVWVVSAMATMGGIVLLSFVR